MYTQHFIAAYNYNRVSKEFGTLKTPVYGQRSYRVTNVYCDGCGDQLLSEETLTQEVGEDAVVDSMGPCENCNNPVSPLTTNHSYVEKKEIIGYEDSPKSREVIEVYGPLNVRIPVNASKQEEIPYLVLETEQHYTRMRDMYPDIASKINPACGNAIFDKA